MPGVRPLSGYGENPSRWSLAHVDLASRSNQLASSSVATTDTFVRRGGHRLTKRHPESLPGDVDA
jgi:hypothetical protein